MNPPVLTTRLFGNLPMIAIFGAFTAYAGWHWFTSGDNDAGFLTIAAACITGACSNARNQVRAYDSWQREWDAMGGIIRRRPSLAAVVKSMAIAIWAAIAWLSLSYDREPGFAVLVALFWLATAVMVVVGIVRWFRRGAPASRARDMAVTVCLAKPAQSPDLREAYADLPDYCRRLVGPATNSMPKG